LNERRYPDRFEHEEIEDGKMMAKVPHYPPFRKDNVVECSGVFRTDWREER